MEFQELADQDDVEATIEHIDLDKEIPMCNDCKRHHTEDFACPTRLANAIIVTGGSSLEWLLLTKADKEMMTILMAQGFNTRDIVEEKLAELL